MAASSIFVCRIQAAVLNLGCLRSFCVCVRCRRNKNNAVQRTCWQLGVTLGCKNFEEEAQSIGAASRRLGHSARSSWGVVPVVSCGSLCLPHGPRVPCMASLLRLDRINTKQLLSADDCVRPRCCDQISSFYSGLSGLGFVRSQAFVVDPRRNLSLGSRKGAEVCRMK